MPSRDGGVASGRRARHGDVPNLKLLAGLAAALVALVTIGFGACVLWAAVTTF